MIVIITFKDAEVETIKNVHCITDFTDGIEIRTNDSTVVSYSENEIADMSVVWR